MRLVDVDLTPAAGPLPEDVRRFLNEAEERIALFQRESRVPAFVPSDYVGGYRVLAALAESTLLRGTQFCEWGSGLGVVTCLAALTGFDAVGIEVSPELVDAARTLGEDADLPVEFVCGSCVPPGAEDRVHAQGEYSWFTTESDSAYDELGLDPSDMDVIFAYPWPDEESMVGELFRKYGGVGSVLVTYGGVGEFRLRRKVRK
jgi:hypothetical protein